MATCTRRVGRNPLAMAAALREAAEEVRAADAMELDDIPMNRYVSPNAVACSACAAPGCPGGEAQAMLEQLVELTCCQNQLLVDLLGAVNALTAALLARQF